MKKLSPRSVLIISGLSLVILGIITAGIGPTLPNFATNNASSLAAVGGILSVMFFGGLLTQLVGGPITDRFGDRPVMIIGLVVMALGIAGVAASPVLALTLACAGLAGMGRGFIALSSHLVVARVYEDSTSAFNALNVFYGVGAIAGPALAGGAIALWGTAIPVIWLGALLLLALLPLALLLDGGPAAHGQDGGAAVMDWGALRQPVLWIFSVILLLYVGSETGFGGWVSTYLERTLGTDGATASLMTGGFWVAITVGRVIASAIGGKVSAPTLMLGSLIGSVVGALLVLLSMGNTAMSIVAIIVLGVSFGPLYPTTLAVVTNAFRRAPGVATSAASAMGALGGTLLPWVHGNLIEYSGPTASVALTIGTTTTMLVLLVAYRMLGRATRAEAAQPAPLS